MAKKKKKSRKAQVSFWSQLSEGAKRALLFIVLITVGALVMLSAFGAAGMVGGYVDQAMALLFGWTRLVAALGLLIYAISLLMPNSERLNGLTWSGILLAFFSITALSNLFALSKHEMTDQLLSMSGGYVGLILQQLGMLTVGFWGTFVILLALNATSLVLIFHPFWDDIQDLYFRWRGEEELEEDALEDEEELDEEEWEEDAETEEDPEEEAFEEDPEEEAPSSPRRSLKNLLARKEEEPEEEVLTTKRRKRIELPLDLLEDSNRKPNSGNIKKNSDIIVRTFANFGIETEVVETSVGPTITQYAIRPAEGVKISRIVSLQNDLALALAAHPIRIEAPIPGKSLVGIEVPNKAIAPVSLRSILESRGFKKSEAVMPFALGKDVTGRSWVTGLEKAPHLLVAGATGSGKSVCLNNIIVSLLYQHGPDALKFILVDPKRVELPAYNGIPHLLVPPITKPEDAINALKWTVREMERRLDVLSAAGVRNIASYNKKSEEQMPYIVFMIDELADLMSTSSREVEALIVRIAQMARAVGIHLVLATQRPSVDVITGTIKANVPTRIAFAVASQTDSRTILDYAGAEKLLGRGDMLFMSPNLAKARRMQGAFLSDKEIKAVVGALKNQDAPDYNYDVVESQKGGGTDFGGGEHEDPLIEDAIEVILAAGKASTSLLQRRLKIGYSRAARIMDMLEDLGAIGPQQGSKPREVLISSIDELNGGAEEPEEDEVVKEIEEEWEEDAEEMDGDGEDEEWEEEDEEELVEEEWEEEDEDDSSEEEPETF